MSTALEYIRKIGVTERESGKQKKIYDQKREAINSILEMQRDNWMWVWDGMKKRGSLFSEWIQYNIEGYAINFHALLLKPNGGQTQTFSACKILWGEKFSFCSVACAIHSSWNNTRELMLLSRRWIKTIVHLAHAKWHFITFFPHSNE